MDGPLFARPITYYWFEPPPSIHPLKIMHTDLLISVLDLIQLTTVTVLKLLFLTTQTYILNLTETFIYSEVRGYVECVFCIWSNGNYQIQNIPWCFNCWIIKKSVFRHSCNIDTYYLLLWTISKTKLYKQSNIWCK